MQIILYPDPLIYLICDLAYDPGSFLIQLFLQTELKFLRQLIHLINSHLDSLAPFLQHLIFFPHYVHLRQLLLKIFILDLLILLLPDGAFQLPS